MFACLPPFQGIVRLDDGSELTSLILVTSFVKLQDIITFVSHIWSKTVFIACPQTDFEWAS